MGRHISNFKSDLSGYQMDQRLRSMNAMRQQRYRQKKLLEDPEFKKKECERIKEIQKRKKCELTSVQAEEIRIRKRKQKQIERAKKRQRKLALANSNEHQTTNSPGFETTSYIQPYKCVQSYSKAVVKCMRSLPSCPIKQKRIVEGVCEHLGLKLAKKRNLSGKNDIQAEKN